MGRSSALVVMLAFFAGFGLASCRVQLPCDSILRTFPSLSIFFEHCLCSYGNWSDVVPLVSEVALPVPQTECESGLKIATGQRIQHPTGYNNNTCGENGNGCEACTEKREEVYSCVTDCQYVNVTAAEVVLQENSEPSSQCASGFAIPGRRRLQAVGGYQCIGTRCRQCEDNWEEIHMCKYKYVGRSGECCAAGAGGSRD